MNIKKLKVREATMKDKGLFKKLFKNLLEYNFQHGSHLLPIEENLSFYLTVFEKYVNKEFEGFVLFVADHAVLMWGSQGETPFIHDVGKIALDWGTYIAPKLRGSKVSNVLREAAIKKAKELGFDVVFGNAPVKNHLSIVTAKKFGFKPLSISAYLDLRENSE